MTSDKHETYTHTFMHVIINSLGEDVLWMSTAKKWQVTIMEYIHTFMHVKINSLGEDVLWMSTAKKW